MKSDEGPLGEYMLTLSTATLLGRMQASIVLQLQRRDKVNKMLCSKFVNEDGIYRKMRLRRHQTSK